MLRKRGVSLLTLLVGFELVSALVGCDTGNGPGPGGGGVIKVTVNQQTVTVLQGSTDHQFIATVEVEGDVPQTVTWSLEGSPKAGTSINPTTGILAVAALEGGGFCIKATSTEDATKYGVAYVNVMTSVSGGSVQASHAWSSSALYPNSSGLTVSPYKIGSTEITYALWYDVYTWATDSARGVNKYTFAHQGREVKNGVDGAVPSSAGRFQPVAQISWRDAIIWCNALSEKTGRTPLYYTDSAKTTVARIAANTGAGENDNLYLQHRKPDANGFGLPTDAEWEFAARGGNPSSEVGSPWLYEYSGGNDPSTIAWTGDNSAP